MLELVASDYRPFIQDIVAWALCLAAFVWGAGPERAMAAVWFSCFEVTNFVYRVVLNESFQLETTDAFLASADFAACVLWIFIALNANRNYPLFIAALQLLVVAAHLARGLIEAISPIAYAVMVIAPGWLELGLLAVGLIRHRSRQSRFGPYREWRVPVQWFGLRQARQR